MAPLLPLAVALVTWPAIESQVSHEHGSLLQMPVVEKTLESDEDQEECRCPGYFEAECVLKENEDQGCVWSDFGSINGPWCQCLNPPKTSTTVQINNAKPDEDEGVPLTTTMRPVLPPRPPVPKHGPTYKIDVSKNAGADTWCIQELSFYDLFGNLLDVQPNMASAQTAPHNAGEAFDIATNNDAGEYCATEPHGWLQYQFPVGVSPIASYTMTVGNGQRIEHSPDSWRLAQSLDGGVSWTLIDE